MKKKVLKTMKKHKMIEKGDNVVVGVSGGPDSMALLYILLELQDEITFKIHVAHVNHGVRGKEAYEDEEFVKNECEKLGISFYLERIDMDGYAKEHKITSEEAGRKLRYDFFRKVLKKQGRGKIAVAHNKNDQAETLVMRFMRGTGMDGLKGMEYKRDNIIRPLLDISRTEIEDYIKRKNIETKLDRTNLQPIYDRNKVRLELIPYIEKNFNPNIINTLVRTSKLITIDSSFLEEYSLKVYRTLVKSRRKSSIILYRDKFVELHKCIKQRVIRYIIEDICGSVQGFTEKHISNVVNLFSRGKTGKIIHLANDLIAKTSYNDLMIEKRKEREKKNFCSSLKINDITRINGWDYVFKTEVIPIEKCKIDFKDRFVKYFDYDKVYDCLYVRNRKDGDKFIPIGMKGSKKLKDFFIDEKIPKEKRDFIPLIVDGEKILWVVGYRISDKYKITEDTKKVLKIMIVKEDKDGERYKRGTFNYRRD